jgi:uncharacterized protein
MFISIFKRSLLALAFGAAAACAGETARTADAAPYDPVTMDPAAVDPAYPPTTIELSFESAGKTLNGHIYIADGAGPHPTVVLLHGLPGNEKNLDIAQAARRAGFNVLFFHYRGAWGSEGDYSFTHVIEDTLAAADFLRGEKAVSDYRIDPTRIIYLGHSMGGFAALAAGARDKAAHCVGAISPADLAILAAMFEDPAAREGFAAYMDKIGEPAGGDRFGPLRGVTGKSAVADIITIGKTLSMPGLAPEFAGRSVLLVGARGDAPLPPKVFYEPLAAAYEAQSDLNLTRKMFESDHVYSSERIALARTVIDWLDKECR